MNAKNLSTDSSTALPGGLTFSVSKVAALQKKFVEESSLLWNQSLQANLISADRRFANLAWSKNPISAHTAALYLLYARTMLGLADAVLAPPKTRAQVKFAVEQWLAASAPSNSLAFNAEAQQKAIESQGASIAQGVRNLLHDLRQGHISMTDESCFELGRNLATTEGQVVFENDYFQLIEYKPLTARVFERPLLLIPPCINKYYILDLQPANSFIRYCVSQGHRTFVISWRNPDQGLAQATWDDYIENAAILAIAITRAIAGRPQINTLGFCVGGTMLGNALAVLAARGQDWVSSSTFLTTFIDFSDTGVLDVFIDENFVRWRELQFQNGGIMPGRDMCQTFAFLRPNDLVWNYVSGNYLKGDTPPPFDLLYWNCDSTNLPGPFYAWYLRNTYLENRFVRPGAARVCGVNIDLRQVKMPLYIYGSREDHIVPIAGAYASTQLFPGKKRFIMGSSGHIAGVINPPSANKRSHWVARDGKFPPDVQTWISGATEVPGSWWPDWSQWLRGYAGKTVVAPKTFGNRKYRAMQAAPGHYVKAKSQ